MPHASALAASDVGAALRVARVRHDKSLDDIARTTKIRVAILRAIENNTRDELPETIFLRGFVRAYAREVGLDPDDAARQYVAQFAPAVELVETGGKSEVRPEGTRLAEAAEANEMTSAQAAKRRAAQWAVIAILVGVAGYGIVKRSDPGTRMAAPARADRVEAAAGTSGSLQPSLAAKAPDAVMHVNMRASARCWVSASVDGSRVVYGLLQAEEERTLEVRRDLVLRIGEPAALTLSINGLPARSLGRHGTPVTVRITSDNYRDFIAQ